MSLAVQKPLQPIKLDCGFYTIVYRNGDHRTLQVKEVTTGYLKGRKIVGYLENGKYVFVGVINYGQLTIWHTWMETIKYDYAKIERVRRAVDIVNADPERARQSYSEAV